MYIFKISLTLAFFLLIVTTMVATVYFALKTLIKNAHANAGNSGLINNTNIRRGLC